MGEVGPIRKSQKCQGKEFNLGPITFLKIRVGEYNAKIILEWVRIKGCKGAWKTVAILEPIPVHPLVG